MMNPVCASGEHCSDCRDPTQDDAFRVETARRLGLTTTKRGWFECPFGVPVGIGDRIWQFLDAIGVHKVIPDCAGCDERRRALNKKGESQ